MMRTPRRCASRGPPIDTTSPPRRISPASPESAPLRIFIRVDLPAPFSPSSTCTSPARTSNETPSRATTPGNDLRMPRICRAGGTSAGGGEAKVGSTLPRLGPAAGHHLGPGVEAHAIVAVDVGIAEEAVLPSAERVVGHRHRDGDVDADHAHLDLVLELACRAAVAGEHGDAVGALVAVDEGQGLVVALPAHRAQHGAEDLVAVHLHARL